MRARCGPSCEGEPHATPPGRLLAESGSARRREVFVGFFLRPNVFRAGQEALQVAHRIVADRHLTQVLLPHIRLDCPASKWLSGDCDHLAFPIHPGIRQGGNHKPHLGSLLPKSARKVVSEYQRVVAALLTQQGDRVVKAKPIWAYVCPIPAAKIESVALCIANQKKQIFFKRHARFPGT